jgi:DHA1 family multidrug resistance protein-like MFS transporter
MSPDAHWRRNLFAITGACFIGFTGFTLVMPFLPLYLTQLGLTDVGEIAFWSGISLGITPAMTALLSPLWGRLSDRFGRKIMVERSLICFVITMVVFAYVTKPWHVLAIRAFQGLFAGYGALGLAMAAESAPPGKMASAIGMVQTAQRLGPALGPVIGGVLAQLVGLRQAFFFASAFYAIGLLLVFFMYHEPKPADAAQGEAAKGESASAKAKPAGRTRVTFRNVLAFEHFVLLMGVIFAIQFVDKSLGPILPLYIAELGVTPERVPIVSGVLFSVLAATASVGHHLTGKMLKTYPPRTIIATVSAIAGVAILVFAWHPAIGVLIAAIALFGVTVGIAMTAAYATAGGIIPHNARATGFGFLTSASLSGLALSPMASGFVAARSIRLVFAIDAVLLALVAAVVVRAMSASFRVDGAQPPAEEDKGEALVASEE